MNEIKGPSLILRMDPQENRERFVKSIEQKLKERDIFRITSIPHQDDKETRLYGTRSTKGGLAITFRDVNYNGENGDALVIYQGLGYWREIDTALLARDK
jgi:hypothetical protein